MKRCEPKITYNKEIINLGEIHKDQSRNSYHGNQDRYWNEQSENFQPTSHKDKIVEKSVKKLAQCYNNYSHAEEASTTKFKRKPKECTFNYVENTRRRYQNEDLAGCLRSKSEYTPYSSNNAYSKSRNVLVNPSSPAVYSKHGTWNVRVPKPNDNKIQCTKSGSIEKLIEKYDKIVFENVGDPPVCASRVRSPIWKDLRLREKYSILKVPWENSQHVAVYKVETPGYRQEVAPIQKPKEHQDPQRSKTYYYDEGSDVDSLYCHQEPPSESITESYDNALQAEAFTLLNIVAWTFFVSIMGLVIWFVSGNQILREIFFPKPPEHPVTRYFKLVAGGMMYSVNSVLKFVGRMLSIPTQQVYHSAREDGWPPTT